MLHWAGKYYKLFQAKYFILTINCLYCMSVFLHVIFIEFYFHTCSCSSIYLACNRPIVCSYFRSFVYAQNHYTYLLRKLIVKEVHIKKKLSAVCQVMEYHILLKAMLFNLVFLSFLCSLFNSYNPNLLMSTAYYRMDLYQRDLEEVMKLCTYFESLLLF